MRGIVDIIIGIVFLVGGLSGKLVFIGTNSGGLLALLGAGLIVWGIVKMVKGRGSPPAQPQ